MQQGNVIFGIILLAYIVFITQRGELPTYLTLLRGGGQQPGSGNSPINITGSGAIGGPAGSALNSQLQSFLKPTSPTTPTSTGNTVLDIFGGSGSGSSGAFNVGDSFGGDYSLPADY